MPGHTPLRFDALPTFETSPVFLGLETESERALRQLPSVRARAVAAMRFRQNIVSDAEHIRVTDADLPIMQVAYLRAALMEFVGMEEVLTIDLASRDRGEIPLRIYDTGDAMLVVLRELRHVQLHLLNSSFDSRRMEAFFRIGGETHPTQVTVLTVPRADLAQVRQLRNAPRFQPSDLTRALEWFDEAQSRWGIDDVVQAGVQRYADTLIAHYSLAAP